MDTQKIGLLIRGRRTELGLTQQELAEKLHITNSAVSKWERGLSAPDIALLPRLADVLGITVTELIGGEPPQMDEVEKSVQEALRFSEKEAARKKRISRRRILLTAILCTLIAAGLCLGILWTNGVFDVIERVPSPDGSVTLTVYDRNIHGLAVGSPAVTVKEEGGRQGLSVYGNCIYEGAWWSPDSTKYVIAMRHTQEGHLMWLENLMTNTSSNLPAYLSMGIMESDLAKYGLPEGNGVFPEMDYRFLQWSEDSQAILIYYEFEGMDGVPHAGYFWYSLADGNIYGILELE